MKKILIPILFIIILNLRLYSCIEAPQCLSYQKDKKDDIKQLSWYIFQQAKEIGIYYWNDDDNKIEFKGEHSNLKMDNGSPFLRTFEQIKVGGEYNYVTYNDQPFGNDRKFRDMTFYEKGGHTKGFFIWNNEGGVHIMHSIPRFPRYEQETGSRKFKLYNGIKLFQPYDQSNINQQQAQYAHCYPISKEEIEQGYVYRHLVLTNSIIGIVNDLAVRHSLSYLTSNFYKLELEPDEKQLLFPKVGVVRNPKHNNIYYNAYFKSTHETFYKGEKFTEDEIMKAILSDISTYFPSGSYKFPLFILAKHALYFIRFSEKFHFESSNNIKTDGSLSKKLNYYQRDNTLPGGTPDILEKIPKTINSNDYNIWEYISKLKITINGKQASQLGELFLQTQQYDDKDKVNDGKTIPGKGLVPKLNDHYIRLVRLFSIEGNAHDRKNDHSKQAFSIPNLGGNYNWFCVGDNNFMTKQSHRGGSVHCFKSTELCEFFAKNVLVFMYEKDGIERGFKNYNDIYTIISKIMIESLSRTLTFKIDFLNNLFPPVKINKIWTHNGNHKYEEYIFHPTGTTLDQIVDISLPLCISSFHRNPSFLICKDGDIKNCNEANSEAYFLCTKPDKNFLLQIIKPVTIFGVINKYQMLGKMKDGDSLFKSMDIHSFFIDVVFHYFVEKLLDNYAGVKPIVSKKQQIAPPDKEENDGSFTEYCTSYDTQNVIHIYGTCLDVLFFCLKYKEDSFQKVEYNDFYNEMDDIIQGDRKYQDYRVLEKFNCGLKEESYETLIKSWFGSGISTKKIFKKKEDKWYKY